VFRDRLRRAAPVLLFVLLTAVMLGCWHVIQDYNAYMDGLRR
jgi:hypothetical protein